jgi:hypothetical protein
MKENLVFFFISVVVEVRGGGKNVSIGNASINLATRSPVGKCGSFYE